MRIEDLRRAVGIAHEGDRKLSGSIAEDATTDQLNVFARCCRQGVLVMHDNILVLLEVIAVQRTAANPWLAKLPADARRSREVTFELGPEISQQALIDLISFGVDFFESLDPTPFSGGADALPRPTPPRRVGIAV